mmetsp:Transcript_46666/g.107845  ORF Transcript_46666/g.107845 Transcript_46666/m.107845 type:complete len:469 (+) Transcript_46666:60-1466(+)
MDVSRSITSLLSTPKRRRTSLGPALSSPKHPKGRGSPVRQRQGELPRKEQADDDDAVLAKLFAGIEDVLVLFTSRRRRPVLAVVRADVEAHTSRDLDDVRLGQILALSRDMLELVWVGTGSGASLELIQRAEDGEARPPNLDEQNQRRARFTAAFIAAASQGQLPSQETPLRPATPGAAEERSRSAVAASGGCGQGIEAGGAARRVPQRAAPHAAVAWRRLEALRQRLVARQEQEQRQAAWQAATIEVGRRISTCEDALALHGVLEHLFARGQGGNAAASEAELLSAVVGCSASVQCRRPMDHEAARIALACLTSKAVGWYLVEAAVHSKNAGSYLRRVEGGSSKPVLEALHNELQQLKRRRLELQSKGCGAVLTAPGGTLDHAAGRDVSGLGQKLAAQDVSTQACGPAEAPTAHLGCKRSGKRRLASAEPIATAAIAQSAVVTRRRLRITGTKGGNQRHPLWAEAGD